MWKSPSIPMTLDIYLYNWTNPEEFLNFTTKPNLVELGPYVFVEKPDKENITWHPENSTVSYMRKSRFYFDEEKSKGSLDDVITSLNVVPLVRIFKKFTSCSKDFIHIIMIFSTILQPSRLLLKQLATRATWTRRKSQSVCRSTINRLR